MARQSQTLEGQAAMSWDKVPLEILGALFYAETQQSAQSMHLDENCPPRRIYRTEALFLAILLGRKSACCRGRGRRYTAVDRMTQEVCSVVAADGFPYQGQRVYTG